MDKLKSFIFHTVTRKAAVSAVTAGIAYLSTPAAVAALSAAGITIDKQKLAAIALTLLAGLAGAIWRAVDKGVNPEKFQTPAAAPVAAAPSVTQK